MSAIVDWALAALARLLPATSAAPVAIVAGATVTAGDVRAAISAIETFHIEAWKDAFESRLTNLADDETVTSDILTAIAAVDPALAGDVAIAKIILALAPYAIDAARAAGFSPSRAGEEAVAETAAREAQAGKRK